MNLRSNLFLFVFRVLIAPKTTMTTDTASLTNDKGAFVRKPSSFRNWITADGSSGFPAESGRYHLYVSYACPFASRALVVRALKGLDSAIGLTVVDPVIDRSIGWSFTDKVRGCQLDTVNGKKTMKEIYLMVDPSYEGRVTVPVLWDKVKQTIVNNESGDIIQMLNSEFNAFCATERQKALDLYPKAYKAQIDELIQWISDELNEGVYKAGFATSQVYYFRFFQDLLGWPCCLNPHSSFQEAYDQAVVRVFAAMENLETRLANTRFLMGAYLTLADVRLFTTLIRFDWVYHGHFKCNKRKLIEYPNLWGYTRDIYNLEGIPGTVDREHIVKNYYMSMVQINPTRIVPIGPDLDLSPPQDRRMKFGVA